jgi:hypothetical protein
MVMQRDGRLKAEQLFEVIHHYMQVNQCSYLEFSHDFNQAFRQHGERSKHNWEQAIGDYNRFV